MSVQTTHSKSLSPYFDSRYGCNSREVLTPNKRLAPFNDC